MRGAPTSAPPVNDPTARPARKFSRPDGAVGSASHCVLETLEIDLLTVGDDEVENANARLVDVVFHALGLGVQEREAHQAHDGGQEAPSRAVHGFGDTF